jgi:hypothetical protein
MQALSLLVPSFLSACLSAPGSEPVSPGAVVAPAETHTLRLTTWTDVLSLVPNNKVMVQQGGQTRVFLTDAQAVTPEFEVTAESVLTLTLKQKNTAEGIALGQSYSHVLADLGTTNEVYDFLTVFQPLLEPVVLDSSATYFVQSASHDRWALHHNEAASFLFPANVGLLVTPREIDAFELYYGLDFEHSDYRMGLVISVGDVEDVGSEGLNVELRFDTYGFTDIPGVVPYFVATSAADAGSADYAVLPEAWEETGPDVADYTITGTLGKGLNLLLFREGGTEGLTEMLASTPSFPPASAPGGSTVAGSDCTPSPPMPSGDETCDLVLPADDPDCPPSGCSPVTPADCTTTYLKAGGRFCGGQGGNPESKTFSITTTVKGGVSVGIKIDGSGISTSGGADSSQTESITAVNGPGANGCGQCAQAWRVIIRCSKTCVVHREKFAWLLLGWYCADVQETVMCIDTGGTSITHCDRTGC